MIKVSSKGKARRPKKFRVCFVQRRLRICRRHFVFVEIDTKSLGRLPGSVRSNSGHNLDDLTEEEAVYLAA